MRKLAPLVFACPVFLFAFVTSALAQHADIMFGAGTLDSLTKPTDIVTFQPPQEKNGIYGSVAGNFMGTKYRFGLNVESAFRYHEGNYYGYETYRPIFTDVNALYQARLRNRMGLDLFGGIGVASNRFTLIGACNIPGCINYTSNNHFLEDLGFGVRYRFWKRFFVRPEVHYYYIHNNQGFNSDNVFRGSVSIGYRFGNPSDRKGKPPASAPAPASQ